MPSNVEIKARVADMKALENKAKQLSGEDGQLIVQQDVFFNVPNGRLKLRILQDQPSQLIYYDRADEAGPKNSSYHISLTDDPDSLKKTLELALGIKGCVKKHRMLYMVDQTRVHVDRVEGLGDFMELEVQMKPDQTVEEGEKIAEDLMLKLNVSEDDLITGAYMDMLLKEKH